MGFRVDPGGFIGLTQKALPKHLGLGSKFEVQSLQPKLNLSDRLPTSSLVQNGLGCRG